MIKRFQLTVASIVVFFLVAAACGAGSTALSDPRVVRPLDCPGGSGSCIFGFSLDGQVYGIDCGLVRIEFVSDETYAPAVDLPFAEVREIVGVDPSLLVAVPASGAPLTCPAVRDGEGWLFGFFARAGDRIGELEASTCQVAQAPPPPNC